MAGQQIRFDDGASYERMMGRWSRIVGTSFLDWLAPGPGLHWIDVGCGTGAFTELIAERCDPAGILGLDPAESQLEFARTRPSASLAVFRQADAMDLPVTERKFDVAIMALVIFFVPDPAKGVAELARVLKPGGTAAAYAWDVMSGGLPTEPILAELRAMGHAHPMPPRPEASRMDMLRQLWSSAGFENVEVKEIAVTREFADYDDYWAISTLSAALKSAVAAMQPTDRNDLKRRVQTRLGAEPTGKYSYTARANAIKGSLPRI